MINKTKRNLKNKKGFTLIELVVVIAVIGILAAIAIPRVTGITSEAKDKASLQKMAVLNSALERYFAEDEKLADTDVKAKQVISKLQTAKCLKDDVDDTLPNGKFVQYNETSKKFEQGSATEGE